MDESKQLETLILRLSVQNMYTEVVKFCSADYFIFMLSRIAIKRCIWKAALVKNYEQK